MFYRARFPSTVDLALAPLRVEADRGDGAGRNDRGIGTAGDGWTAPSDDALDACFEFAVANGFLGLLTAALKRSGAISRLPVTYQDRLEGTLARGRSLDAALLADTSDALRALRDRKIHCLVLKGGAWSRDLYELPGLRPRRDLDLLVRPADLERSRSTLEGVGFVSNSSGPVPRHHLPRLERRRTDGSLVAIDIHHRLVPARIYGVDIQPIEGLWERSVEVDVGDGQANRTLSHLDHAVHMHLHLFHHLFYNFRLMHLIDIALAARRWADLDWVRVHEALDACGLPRLALDVPNWIGATLGDAIATRVGPPSDSALRTWLFRHGSLPDLTGLRYASGARQRLRMLAHEARRAVFRLRGPEIRPPSEWSTP
jgi:hypothetical protein